MSKNLIPEICKMLGVELGEAFKIKGEDELTYRFDSDGLKLTHDSGIELAKISSDVAFAALVKGTDEIVKLPWKPKKGEYYYTFGCRIGEWEVSQQLWTCHPFDLAVLAKGWAYPTREEAESALPKIATEMGVKYKL